MQRLPTLVGCLLAIAVLVPLLLRGGADGTTRLKLTMADYGFSPDAITLSAGRPAVISLVNNAAQTHTFTVLDMPVEAVTGATIKDAPVKVHNAPVSVYVALFAGERTQVQFTPTTGGTYKLICSRLGHDSFGMEATITVLTADH